MNPDLPKILNPEQLEGRACVVCGEKHHRKFPLGLQTRTSSEFFRCDRDECAVDPVKVQRWIDASDPLLPSSDATTKLELLLKISDKADKRNEFEVGWVGSRMTWLILSQAFLFSAFAASSSSTAIGPLHNWLRWVIIVVAIGVNLFTYLSILAAKSVNRRTLFVREMIDKEVKETGGKTPEAALFQEWPVLGVPARSGKMDPLPRWWPRRCRDEWLFKHSYYFGGMASHALPLLLLAAWTFIGLRTLFFVGDSKELLGTDGSARGQFETARDAMRQAQADATKKQAELASALTACDQAKANFETAARLLEEVRQKVAAEKGQ